MHTSEGMFIITLHLLFASVFPPSLYLSSNRFLSLKWMLKAFSKFLSLFTASTICALKTLMFCSSRCTTRRSVLFCVLLFLVHSIRLQDIFVYKHKLSVSVVKASSAVCSCWCKCNRKHFRRICSKTPKIIIN